MVKNRRGVQKSLKLQRFNLFGPGTYLHVMGKPALAIDMRVDIWAYLVKMPYYTVKCTVIVKLK